MKPCHRLFFALLPPSERWEQIARVDRWFGGIGSRVRSDRRHMTLCITGDHDDYPHPLAAAMVAAGDAVIQPSFPVALDQVSGSSRSVALRPGKASRGLAELQREIENGARACGVPLRRHWSFSPHVTLLYRDGRSFIKSIESITWDAGDFVLIHSWVGRTQHNILKRWPLVAPAFPKH